jgi:60 kDa SS-A/Ro ribonucleoprotein
MNSRYRNHFSTRETAQTQPIPGETMVQNNAGGFTFEVSPWDQLIRFLILGSEEGSYYVGERELTVENAQNVLRCIQADGPAVVRTVAEVSNAGRAPKNEPALFALAMCAGMGDDATRKLAFEALPQVARTGTHLLHFTNFMEGFRGWGRAARRGIGNWFTQLTPEQLGYQFLKYAQREGWAMRDLLRLSHPQAPTEVHNALFKYIVKGKVAEGEWKLLPDQIHAAVALRPEMVLNKSGVAEAARLIVEHRLPREAVPTQLLTKPEIWEALLQHMPMTAMIRNLGKMTEVGLITPLSDAAKKIVSALGNTEAIQKARIHPINVLSALLTYQNGGGFRGKLTWDPNSRVVDALDGAFYSAFKFVEPTGARILIGLDVSGSMGGNPVNGLPFLDARTAAAAMCMTVAKTEANWHVMAFSHEFVPLSISPRQRLGDVVRTTSGLPFGGTDCALPMVWALQTKTPVDAFVIYTDNETWFGKIHPVQALRNYRDRMGIPSKFIVNAMTATKFSVAKSTKGTLVRGGEATTLADPKDRGMLDVVGLDSAAPQVMADFIRG